MLEHYVVRTPILDRGKNLVGYDLHFHECSDRGCRPVSVSRATEVKIIVEGLPQVIRDIPAKASIHLDARLVMAFDGLSELLSPGQFVLDCRCSSLDETWVESVADLHAKGFRLALRSYDGSPLAQQLLAYAENVGIDFFESSSQVLTLRSRLQGDQTLMAENLSTWEEFEGAKALGFNQFQGPYFAVAETVKGQRIATHRATRLNLMGTLASADIDLERVVNIIASDPPLSFRLLQFINSSIFGFTARVESLRRAVALMGVRPLRAWAMLVLISDMDSSDKGNELVWHSLQRAIFLQQASGRIGGKNDSDKLFLLGMFSNLEAIIGIPLEEILDQVHLDGSIHDALIHERGYLASWVRVLRALDSPDAQLSALLARVGLSRPLAAQLYMRASALASEALNDNCCSS